MGHVRSVHDQRVFRLSEVQTYLGNVSKFPEDCHLVGDLAYKLHENLLIPYRDNGHFTERQRNYNFCHASARIVIERAFGLLKGRFRSLLTVLAIQRIDLVPLHILACCVLHNVCIMKGDEFNEEINKEMFDCMEDNPENVCGAAHVEGQHSILFQIIYLSAFYKIYSIKFAVDAARAGASKRDLITERLRIRNV